jgi:hypothetical protein
MTVSTTAYYVTVAGNGATTTWSYTFPVPAVAELSLILTDSAGTQTTLSTALWSVTGVPGSAGGTFTYPLTGSPLAAGNTLTLLRTVPLTQETSLPAQGASFPPTVEAALDVLTMQMQQVAGAQDRALRAPEGEEEPLVLPTRELRAGAYLAFDDNGDPVVGSSPTGGVVVSAAMNPVVGAASLAAARTAMGVVASNSGAADGITLTNFLAQNGGMDTVALANCSFDSANGGQLGGVRNPVVNGDFSVNQTAIASAADDAYCTDGWYVLCDGGSVTTAQQTVQEDLQPYSFRLTQPDVTAKRIGMAQIIEARDARRFRNAQVSLGMRVRCSLPQPIRYAILGWAGTADAVTSDVVNNWSSTSYTAGGFFIGTVSVIAVGSLSPTANTWAQMAGIYGTAGTINNLIVFVWTEGTLVQNGTLDVGLVQMEPGVLDTPFERLPYVQQLARAQRLYVDMSPATSQSLGLAANTSASSTVQWPLVLPTPLRATPAVTTTSLLYAPTGASSINVNSATAALVGNTAVLTVTLASSTGAGTAGLIQGQGSGTPAFRLDARL